MTLALPDREKPSSFFTSSFGVPKKWSPSYNVCVVFIGTSKLRRGVIVTDITLLLTLSLHDASLLTSCLRRSFPSSSSPSKMSWS